MMRQKRQRAKISYANMDESASESESEYIENYKTVISNQLLTNEDSSIVYVA